MTPTLETARLLLRPIELADADQIQATFPQWEIVKHLNSKVPWPYPPDGAFVFLRDISLPAIDPAWQRGGLMTEASDAANDFWFETLKHKVMRVKKAIANEGSRRISEKQGMRVVSTDESDYVSGRLPSEIWEITAEEWRARKSSKA